MLTTTERKGLVGLDVCYTVRCCRGQIEVDWEVGFGVLEPCILLQEGRERVTRANSVPLPGCCLSPRGRVPMPTETLTKGWR
jgi:hypothetical protein